MTALATLADGDKFPVVDVSEPLDADKNKSVLASVIKAYLNPLTTAGDLLYGGVSGAQSRLALGTTGYVLKAGASAPEWGQLAHSALTGLTTGDPHTQYLLVAGTRAGTGWQEFLGLNLTDAVEATIAAGSVTATQSALLIDTEGDASTDDLDTIVAATGAGDLLFLRPASDARTVVLKHGTGNIYNAGGGNVTMDTEYHWAMLKRWGTVWLVIAAGASSFDPANPGAIGGTTPAAGTFTELNVATGTITASNPALDATQTWNNSGVTFTGMKLSITDTASASGSLPIDIQLGGSSLFNVSKKGAISSTSGSSQIWTYGPSAGSGYTFSIGLNGSSLFEINNAGLVNVVGISISGQSVLSGSFGNVLVSGNTINLGNTDTVWTRAAAATVQQGANHATAPTDQVYQAGGATSGNNNGADLTIKGGAGSGSGVQGNAILDGYDVLLNADHEIQCNRPFVLKPYVIGAQPGGSEGALCVISDSDQDDTNPQSTTYCVAICRSSIWYYLVSGQQVTTNV